MEETKDVGDKSVDDDNSQFDDYDEKIAVSCGRRAARLGHSVYER